MKTKNEVPDLTMLARAAYEAILADTQQAPPDPKPVKARRDPEKLPEYRQITL